MAPYRIRAMTAGDADRDRAFISKLSSRSRYQRFMHSMREPAPELIRGLANVDGHRNVALVACVGEPPDETIVGVARYSVDRAGECEFAVAVADDWQCRGIGSALMRSLFEHAAREGHEVIYGNILADNGAMIDLARHLGLEVDTPQAGQPTIRAWRRLR